MKIATFDHAQLVKLYGPGEPSPGKLGVIQEGAYADLLLINGDPLADIEIMTRPDENLDLIMKDGKIYKNTVE